MMTNIKQKTYLSFNPFIIEFKMCEEGKTWKDSRVFLREKFYTRDAFHKRANELSVQYNKVIRYNYAGLQFWGYTHPSLLVVPQSPS